MDRYVLPFCLLQMGMHASSAGSSLDGLALWRKMGGIREETPFRLGKSCHPSHQEVLWLFTLTSTAHGMPPTRSDARTAVRLEMSIVLVLLLSGGRDDSW